MGSNTFRLVVFRYRPGGSFQLVDEIRDVVRLSGGAGPDGLHGRGHRARGPHRAALRRLLRGGRRGRRRPGGDQRGARRGQRARRSCDALSADGALPVRILSAEEEAWYGYLGVVNSTTLGDGHVLDLGGGSVQISQVVGRGLGRTVSRPLGAVRMTERFLPRQRALARRHQGPAQARRPRAGRTSPWLERPGGRMVGIGGTIRTLAAMHQRRTRLRRSTRSTATC